MSFFETVKYKRVRRVLSILLACFFVLSSLCSCTSSVDGEKKVGKVGEYEVLYDEFYFLASSYKEGLEAKYGEYEKLGADDVKKFDDELRELVYSNIVTNYAILALCADNGLTLDAEDLDDRVDEYIKNMIESEFGSKSEYKNNLKEYGLSDRYVRFTAAVDILYSDLLSELLKKGEIEDDEEKVKEIVKKEFVRTWHIMISNDAGEDVEANRAKAEEALAKYRDGSMSMYKLIGSSYNEDLSISDLDGLYFTRGSMTKEYEKAAFELEVGEVSDVFEAPATNAMGETVTGFYVIQRLEIEDEYVEKNLASLMSDYHDSVMYSMLESKRGTLEFEPDEYAKSAGLASLESPSSSSVATIVVFAVITCVAAAGVAIAVVMILKSKKKKALVQKKK